jgi:glucan phosphorylase
VLYAGSRNVLRPGFEGYTGWKCIAGNVFTTHTTVAAGFDRFDPELIRKYLGEYTKDELALPLEDLLAMDRQNSADSSQSFNMAYLALRGSGQINGVSKLHGQVSRQIFQPLFPLWPQEDVPIGSAPTAFMYLHGIQPRQTRSGPTFAARNVGAWIAL